MATETDSTAMATVPVKVLDIPEYLRGSSLHAQWCAKSMDGTVSMDDTYQIPISAIKPDSELNTIADVLHLLHSLHFWQQRILPDSLYNVVFLDAERTVLLPYCERFLASLPSLRNVLSIAAATKPENRMFEAAATGDLHLLDYLHRAGHAWNNRECCIAAHMGHLECLKYARKRGCAWTDGRPKADCACSFAARAGHLDCLRYAHKRGCPVYPDLLLLPDVQWNLDCLEYLLDQHWPLGYHPRGNHAQLRHLCAQVAYQRPALAQRIVAKAGLIVPATLERLWRLPPHLRERSLQQQRKVQIQRERVEQQSRASDVWTHYQSLLHDLDIDVPSGSSAEPSSGRAEGIPSRTDSTAYISLSPHLDRYRPPSPYAPRAGRNLLQEGLQDGPGATIGVKRAAQEYVDIDEEEGACGDWEQFIEPLERRNKGIKERGKHSRYASWPPPAALVQDLEQQPEEEEEEPQEEDGGSRQRTYGSWNTARYRRGSGVQPAAAAGAGGGPGGGGGGAGGRGVGGRGGRGRQPSHENFV